MTCEKCPACGLVLENHDYSMAINCTTDLGYSYHELAMKQLRRITKEDEGKRHD